jgi:hypothetical protein
MSQEPTKWFIHLRTRSVPQAIYRRIEGFVNNEFERMRKEAVYHGISVEGMRKSTKHLSQDMSLRVQIWTRDFPNTKQVCLPLDRII